MKTITFNIPTSIAEFKQMRREKMSKRYKNNVQVVRDVINGLIRIAHNGYWRKDISETFLNRVWHGAPYSSEIDKIYREAKERLK